MSPLTMFSEQADRERIGLVTNKMKRGDLIKRTVADGPGHRFAGQQDRYISYDGQEHHPALNAS
jgi:hypothetical protein